MASLIGGIIGLAVAVIVFTTVLMPQIVGVQLTNVSGSGKDYTAAEQSLWQTVGLIAVVGMLFVMLGVFGVSA